MDMPLIWGWALIVVGAVLLVGEFFIPTGGALGVTSVVLAAAGVVVLWLYEGRTWGLTGLLAIMILGPAALAYGLKVWPNTPTGRRIIGSPSEDAAQGSPEPERLNVPVGTMGVVVTDLRPVGTVEIAGKRYDAISETMFVKAGARVTVTGRDVAQLKVRQQQGEPAVS